MPEHNLRFGVRTHDGRTSDVWKCWTRTGTNKRDVYLTSRPLGHALKLSLHEEGQWHVGFDSNKKDKLFSPGEAPLTRFLGKWDRPDVKTSPLVLAARIYFPWTSPSDAKREAPHGTVWIEAASAQQANEVAIFLVNEEIPANEWPGKASMNTALVGKLPLEGGGCVCIVQRMVTAWPQPSSTQATPKFFRGKSEGDLADANRIVVWGQEPDGSISFLEARVDVNCKKNHDRSDQSSH
jgi:hypothetical protein